MCYGVLIEQHDFLTYKVECISLDKVGRKVQRFVHDSVSNVNEDVAACFLLNLLEVQNIPEDTAVIEYHYENGHLKRLDTHLLGDFLKVA